MKKIYLCYVVSYQNGVKERAVITVFSKENKAKNYCKYWNTVAIEDMLDTTYFYEETVLDRFAGCY